MADDESERALSQLVESLGGASRRGRQDAAHTIAQLAKTSPDRLIPYAPQIIDALDRPEAQTRWEVLSALTDMLAVSPQDVAEAFEGAETSLFDEASSPVRLGAFTFLARYGASSPDRSDQAWPLLDEAVQCYHGDPEYHDMLVQLLEFAQGDISDKARASLVARVSFDAQNGRGYLKALSSQIVAKAQEA